MKKIFSILLVLALALSLAACGGSAAKPTSPPEPTAEPTQTLAPTEEPLETTAPTEEPAASRPPVSEELPSEWTSFQFELEGVIYTLPLKYSELEANGWVLENEDLAEEMFEVNTYTLVYQTLVNSNKENCEISVQLANLDSEERAAKDCYISGIQYTANQWTENTVIYFPGGLTSGSTMADVQALYGETEDTTVYTNTTECEYSERRYSGVLITYNNETETIEKMRMTNMFIGE